MDQAPRGEVLRLPPNPARDAVLSEMAPEIRSVMGPGTARVELRPYTDRSGLWHKDRFARWKDWNPQEKFLGVMKQEAGMHRGGDFYRHVFALAAAAQDPIELQNAFGALGGVASYSFTSKWTQENVAVISAAQDAFLQTTTTPTRVKPQISELSRYISAEWAMNPHDDQIYRIFQRYFYKTSGHIDEQQGKFFAETFTYMVLNRDLPMEFRKGVLNSIPFYFGFGQLDREEDAQKPKPFFQRDASFFEDVDVSWIYPHMAHFRRGASPERAGLDVRSLGEEYDKLQTRVGKVETGLRQAEENLAQALRDKESLQRIVDRLGTIADGRRGMSSDEREAAVYYKRFGGHPLNVLSIGTIFWAGWTPEQRGEELKKAYRTRARQYHYDVARQDPSYDEMKALLMGREFEKITEAKNYLEQNLARAQFPDFRR